MTYYNCVNVSEKKLRRAFLGSNFGNQPILRRRYIFVDRSFGEFSYKSHKRTHVAVVRRLEVLVILVPFLDLDDDGRIAVLHEPQIHEQSRRSSVPVDERMNPNELVVLHRRASDGMQSARLARLEPLAELAHVAGHGVGRRRFEIADEHLPGAKVTGLIRLDASEHVQMKEKNVVQVDATLIEKALVHEVKSVADALDFVVLLQRLSRHDDARFEHGSRHAQRHRIAFDCDRVIDVEEIVFQSRAFGAQIADGYLAQFAFFPVDAFEHGSIEFLNERCRANVRLLSGDVIRSDDQCFGVHLLRLNDVLFVNFDEIAVFG